MRRVKASRPSRQECRREEAVDSEMSSRSWVVVMLLLSSLSFVVDIAGAVVGRGLGRVGFCSRRQRQGMHH
jgi:hypothetical protein